MYRIFHYGFVMAFTGLCMMFLVHLVDGYSTVVLGSSLIRQILFIPRLFLIFGILLLILSLMIWFRDWAKSKAEKIS
ncbi:hypothetical protein P9214_12980 [Heyndrickxia coagulans]|uniref:hypothetical protein n=1 Tax=Heyndrickxia coagulans TaxID=1398 RepID=UPI002E1DB3B5|nr:hypothetical protein [Heyndrickxia coagulans]